MPFSSLWRKFTQRNSKKAARRGPQRVSRYRKYSPNLERLEERTAPAIFTVANNADVGAGSLRQAIIDANTLAGLDTIVFNLPAAQKIITTTGLPTISEQLIIDGKTQNGYTPGTPFVIVRGAIGNTASGFFFSFGAGLAIVDGIQLESFGGDGIRVISGGGINASMTDNDLVANTSDGMEFIGAASITLRENRARRQVLGAAVSITTLNGTYSDTNAVYSNNGENGIRLEDVSGDVRLRNVTAINNNTLDSGFDPAGTGSGFVAFDGFDPDLFAIRGNVLFEGCNFGEQGFNGGAELFQRQINGIVINGVEGSIVFDSFGGIDTHASFNRAHGVLLRAAQDVTEMRVFFRGGDFNNNGGLPIAPFQGDGIKIDLVGAAIGLVDVISVHANNNGDSGLEVRNINGPVNITSSVRQVEFSFNGLGGTGGDGATFANVGDITFTTGTPGTGVLMEGNRDAGMQVDAAASLTDADGFYLKNYNGGIRVRDILGDVILNRPTLENNDANGDLSGDGFTATDSPADIGNIAIGGDLIMHGATVRATLSSSAPGDVAAQVNGIFVQHVAGSIVLDTSVGVVRNTLLRDHSEDGLHIEDARDITLNLGSYIRNGRTLPVPFNSSTNSGDGIELREITGAVTFTGLLVDDNGKHGLVGFNIGGAVQINNTNFVTSSFSNNGVYTGPGPQAGGDGINLLNAGTVQFTSVINGIVANNNKAAGGMGGHGVFIQNATSLSDSIGTFSGNDDGGIYLRDINGDVTLVRTTVNNNDGNQDDVGDGMNAIDIDNDGFAIRGNLLVQGGSFRDTSPSDDQQNGVFINGLGGTAIFQNAGAQTMQVTGNEQDGVHLENGVTATFTNGSYSNNGVPTTQDGIDLNVFTGLVTLTNLTVNTNGSDGAELDNLGSLVITNGTYSFNGDQGIDAHNLGSVGITTVQFNSNVSDGAHIGNVLGAVSLTSVTANFNGDDGFEGHDIAGTTTILTSNFNDNAGDGLEMDNVGDVVTTTVNGLRNDPGININTAASWTDTDGVYSANDNDGIRLADISGNVTLTRTRAENNDANLGGVGDGLFAFDDGDGDTVAIGGNLTINGGRFRDTSGFANPVTRQIFGINVQDGVAGDVLFQNSGVIQMEVTGNEVDGAFIGGGTNATFTNGSYSNNGDDGLDLQNFTGAILLTNVTATGNGSDGVEGSNFSALTINGGTFTGNDDDGVDLDTFTTATFNGGVYSTNTTGSGLELSGATGPITLTTVVANGNGESGLDVSASVSVFDTDGTYSGNNHHGVALVGISGNVTLVRTIARDNDADNAVDGDGVNADAIGGILLVQGGNFSNSLVPGGTQEHGVFIGSVAGSTTFQNSGVQQVNASANSQTGVTIGNGGAVGTFTNGTYNGNGDDGLELNSFGTLTLTTVQANSNTGVGTADGAEIGNTTTVNVSGGNFNGNGGDGLDIFNSTMTLTGVTATGNLEDGVFGTTLLGLNTISGGTFSSNTLSGIALDGAGAGARLVLTGGVNASSNGGDGLFATDFLGVPTAISITGGTFNNNTGDGIDLLSNGVVVTSGVTATGNDPGINIDGAASYSDTGSTFSGNDNHGLALTNITGNITLVRTTADNNDADNVGGGDGVNITGAFGGNLLVQGGRFRDTDGVAGVAFTQQRGVFVGSTLTGTAIFQDSAGPTQSNIVTGNNADGVVIADGGTTATFTNGDYSNNGLDGIDVSSTTTVNVNTLTANGNGDDGVFLNGFTTANVNGVTANNNASEGFQIQGGTTLNINDYTGKNNTSGDGGFILFVTTVNFTTTTGVVADDVTLAPGSFQHTRAGDVQQEITYFAIDTLCIFLGAGDDQLMITAGNYGPFFVGSATLKVEGGLHTVGDALTFNATNLADTIVVNGINITINGNPVSNPPGVVTTLTGFEILGVNGLQGNDTFTVLALPTAGQFPAVRLNGNEDNDFMDGSAAAAEPGVRLFMNGNEGNDTLIGHAGDDTLTGGIGNDTLFGGLGNDTVAGDAGNDSLAGGAGTDSLDGGAGNDTYFFAGAGLGSDTVNDLAGCVESDTLDFSGLLSATTVNLNSTLAQVVNPDLTITLTNNTSIENVLGTGFNDNYTGNACNNNLVGALGNDTLVGGAGNDTLNGGGGNDRYPFTGTLLGTDNIVEPGGCVDLDTIDFSGFGSAVTINLSSIVVQVVAGGNLSLILSATDAIENLIGSNFNDSLTGNLCNNDIDGLDGNDTLVGGLGSDTLDGGNQNDLMIWNPGDGSDTMDGGSGTDTVQVNGGGGAETFTLVRDGGRIDFDRTSAVAFNLDCGTVETFDINMNAGADTLTATMDLPGVTTLDVDGGPDGDTFIIDYTASNTLPTTVIYTGGTGTDVMRQQGGGTAFGSVRYTAIGAQSGSVNLDGQNISFNTTETLDHVKPTGALRYDLSGADDTAQLANGPLVNGFATLSLSSLTSTFATLNFGNLAAPGTFTLAMQGGSDTFTALGVTAPAGLTGISLYGHSPEGTLDDSLVDHFTIRPSTTVPYFVDGDDPLPVLCPGDSLETDIAGLGITQTLTPGVPGAGVYSFSGGFQSISFQSIEDLAGLQIIVTGTDFGTIQRVRVFDAATGAPLPGVWGTGFNPFSGISGFKSGIRVAAGDVNGDCFPDIIVASGPQQRSFVRVYDGRQARTGGVAQIGGFTAFENSFTGGVYISAADFDGDGKAEIVVGAGKPATARVRVFNGASVIISPTPAQLYTQIVAFPTTIKGGARVATGDYNGDGTMDIAVTIGSGKVTQVRVIDGTTLDDGFQAATDLLDDFQPFESTFKRGAFISMVDLDGDGDQEIQVSRSAESIVQTNDTGVGAIAPIAPEVRSFSYDGNNYGGGAKVPDFAINPFFGTGNPANGGIRLGSAWDGVNSAFTLAVTGRTSPATGGLVKRFGNNGVVDAVFSINEALTQGYFVAGSKRNDGRII